MQPSSPVYLHAIGTAVPSHRLPQSSIRDFMKRLHPEPASHGAFLDKVYGGSAIEWRHSVLADYGKTPADFDFYPANERLTPAPGTAARNDRYASEAETLALQASRALFDPEGAPPLRSRPADITHIITLSCTGFSAPGFDLALVKQLDLDPGVQRSHLGFMGCNAAFPAFNLAVDIARANPEARILIVSVELCTLHFQSDWNPETVVANALFADGAAAALVSARFEDSGAPLFAIGERQSRIVPDTASRMAWTIGDTGFDMVLSAYVPRVIETELGPLMEELLRKAGAKRSAITHWAVHPGGRAILDRVAESLQLPAGALACSYDILRDYGNMSSATLFFVLRQLASKVPRSANAKPGDNLVFATSFGPGLSIESALLQLHPQPVFSRLALFFPDMSRRSHAMELMDDPAIDRVLLRRTLKQFNMLNSLFSAYRGILKRELLGRLEDRSKVYRVLDIGCGGGDILVWLAKKARRLGWKLELVGIDPDRDTVRWTTQALAGNWPEITIIQASSRDLPRLGSFDHIISNHVLHHLSRRQAVELLRTAHAHCSGNLIINDICRSAWAYVGYTIFTGLFVRRSLAFYDGRLSIRRSFSQSELSDMVSEAGLADSLQVRFCHPARVFTSRLPAGASAGNESVLSVADVR